MKLPSTQNLLTSTVALFATAAVAVAGVSWWQQETLSGSYRYDVSWSAQQSKSELATFGGSLGAWQADPESRKARRRVDEKLDVLRSRVKEMQSAAFADFVRTADVDDAIVSRIRDGLAALAPMIDAIDADDDVRDVYAKVDAVNRDLSLLAAAADSYTTQKAQADRDRLRISLRVLCGMLAGLVLGGIALVVMIRRAATRLAAQKAIADGALDNMSQGLAMFASDGTLVVHNPRLAEVLGVDPGRIRQGIKVSEFAGDDNLRLLAQRPRRGELEEFVSETADGRVISATRRSMARGGWLATFDDITERRRQEAKVAWLANHDELTGLPNRVRFKADLEAALEASRSSGLRTALVCLDLNRFKAVNDTLGHHVGDLLLKEMADRVRRIVTAPNTFARLGGDEFSIVQVDVGDREETVELVSRIIEAVKAPYRLDGHTVAINTSAGIAFSPQDASEADQLMVHADIALYKSKEDGHGSFRFFEPGMDQRLQDRRMFEIDLQSAMERGEFELHFQPIVDLADHGRVTCYETLLRWRHPERGMVPPVQFIPVAEEIGLIVPLGSWIMHEACRQAAAWTSDARVAVNVSAVQFKRDDILALVTDALAASGLAPSRLEVEITESILVEENENVSATLDALRERGVRIAMDDFGTGYSSLSYLSKFAFNKLKIDRSFVMNMDDPKNREIVEVIVSMGRKLGMTVTAEGVEKPEQAAVLASLGCNEGQGYHFSRPKPGRDFPELSIDLATARAA